MIVVDASVVVDALLGSTPGLTERLLLEEADLHAPHLIDVEVASALRKLVAAGRVPAPRAGQVLQDFQDLRLRRYPHAGLLPRVWELRGDLSPYDALYVALAEAMDAPLLTKDKRLAAAPGHATRVEVV